MLQVSSGLDGYPSNWARACDTCHAAACTLYCHTDSAYLCQNCDECIHVADSTASQHERVWVCTVCENAPAAFTCQADAASLCISCDIEIHSANPLARRHNRVPIPLISGIGYATSTSYGGQPQGPLLVTENKNNEEEEEDETDSWLLLDLDHTDNQTNSGFTYAEEAQEYLDLAEYNLSRECECEDKNYQQEYSNVYQEDNNSDNVFPVQRFEAKEQQQKQQQNEPAKQPQHQQQQKNTFDMEYEASKTAFINPSSNSQRSFPDGSLHGSDDNHPGISTVLLKRSRNCLWSFSIKITRFNGINVLIILFKASGKVPMLLVNAGYQLKAANDISSSYPRFPKGTANLFPNPSLPMPLQLAGTNREARVLRYREKRQARKFEKKIRYASRKANAEARPRVKGRFARKTDMEFDVNQTFSTEDYGRGILPS